jgi:hypothetical protein
MADLGRQLELQRQINKVLSERQTLLDRNASALNKQARLAKEVCKALECKELENLEVRLSNINNRMADTAQKARNAASGMDDLNHSAKEASSSLDKVNKNAIKIGAGIGFIKGLRKGFQNLKNILQGAGRLLGSFVKSLFNIGKAMIRIPFRIFSGLVEMSNSVGSPAFLQALQEIKKTFGELGSGTGKAAANSVREMRRDMGGLGGDFGRMFGYGPEGMAAGLKFNMEMLSELGGTFAAVKDELKGNYSELAKYRKGLGLTASAQGLMIKLAHKSGEDIMKFQRDFAAVATNLGEKTEYSAREIGQSMGAMYEDVKNFGGFTKQELGAMSVATKRLGVDMKALIGVIGAFDDFDKAAENVAFLNRNFGMQIDLMRLHRTEDPVERIQMLQKSFKRAGLEVEKMGRRELAALAAKSGMGEKEARILYARNNLDGDYNKIKALQNKHRKKELTQAQVLNKLMKQIERVFGSGGKNYKGFFDALGKGFSKGIRRSSEFRGVMRNLRRSLRAVDHAGQRLGRNFVKHFPGVREMLGALKDFFNPAKLVPALRDINKHFLVFFQALQTGERAGPATDRLGKAVMGTLRKYFGGKGQALDMFKKSFKTIITLYGQIKLHLLKKSIEMASKTIHAFTDGLTAMMSGGGGVVDGFGEVGAFAGNAFGVEFKGVIDAVRFDLIPAIKRAAPVIAKGILVLMKKVREFMWKHRMVVFEAIKDVMIFIFKMKWEFLKFAGKTMMENPVEGMILALTIAGPAFGGAIVGALKFAFASKIIPMILTRFAPNMALALFGSSFVSSATPMLHKGLTASLNAATTGPAVATAVKKTGFARLAQVEASLATKAASGTAGTGMMAGLKKFGTKFGPKLLSIGKKAGIVGLALGVGMGFYSGTKRFMNTKGPIGFRLKEAGKGLASSLLSGLTFGLVSSDSIENFIFGPSFAAPIEEAQYRLSKSSNQTARNIAASFKQVSMQTDAYVKHAKSLKAVNNLTNDINKTLTIREKIITQTMAGSQKYIAHKAKYLKQMMKDNTLETELLRKQTERALMNPGVHKLHRTQLMQSEKDFAGKALRTAGLDKMADEFLAGEIYLKVGDPQVKAALDAARQKEFDAREKFNSDTQKKLGHIVSGGFQLDKLRSMGPNAVEEYKTSLSKRIAEAKRLQKPYEGLEAELSKIIKKVNTERILLFRDSGVRDKMVTAQLAKYESEWSALDSNKGRSFKGSPEYKMMQKSAFNDVQTAIKTGQTAALTAAAKAEFSTQQIDPSLKVGATNAQEEKLQAMEAAAETVKRIQALMAIPGQLKALEKQLKGVSEDKIKKQADTLVKSACFISEAMNAAVEKYKLNDPTKQRATITSAVMDQISTMSTVRKMVGEVVDKPIPSQSKQKERIDLLKYGVDHSLTTLLAMGEGGETKLAGLAKAQKLFDQAGFAMSGLVTGVFGVIPDNINKQVKGADTAITGITKAIRRLTKGSDGTTIKSVVDLAKAVNKEGELVVRHEGAKMVAQIHLHIDSRELASAMISVANIDGNGKRIATTP